MTTKYLLINETTFNDSVATEVLSLWSTYNKALTALDDIARELDVILDEDDSSFALNDKGGSFIEYYVTSMEEDEA